MAVVEEGKSQGLLKAGQVYWACLARFLVLMFTDKERWDPRWRCLKIFRGYERGGDE